MSYFLIHCSEDGLEIEQLSRTELLKRITPDKSGNTYYGGPHVFLDKVPESSGDGFWKAPENAVLIIQGEIIQPKPVTIVTKLTLGEDE